MYPGAQSRCVGGVGGAEVMLANLPPLGPKKNSPRTGDNAERTIDCSSFVRHVLSKYSDILMRNLKKFDEDKKI